MKSGFGSHVDRFFPGGVGFWLSGKMPTVRGDCCRQYAHRGYLCHFHPLAKRESGLDFSIRGRSSLEEIACQYVGLELNLPLSHSLDGREEAAQASSKCRVIGSDTGLDLVIDIRVLGLEVLFRKLRRQGLAIFGFDRVKDSLWPSGYRDDLVPTLQMANDSLLTRGLLSSFLLVTYSRLRRLTDFLIPALGQCRVGHHASDPDNENTG